MKKHIFFFLTAFTLWACQKDDIISSDKATYYEISIAKNSPYTHPTAPIGTTVNYQIKDQRIVLNELADFDVFFWSILEKDYSNWVNKTKFNSLWDDLEYTSTTNRFDIQKILNRQGIIEVKPWIFKLDFDKEKVFVVSSSHRNATKLLETSSLSHPSILVFDFADDVWNELLNQSPTSKILRCNEERAKNKYISTSAQSCSCSLYNWQTTTIAVKYNRFGIWETVKASYYNNLFDVYGQSNGNYTPAQINSGHFHYHFDERCGKTYYGTLNINPGIYAEEILTLRSSKKPLERYKSVVNINVNTSYILNPAEPAQQLNCILDQF